MNDDRACEGSCDEHHGEVISVSVRHNPGFDWGQFDYCAAAIAEDRRRGLTVTPVAGEPA